jgi:predicted DNA binding CopG/RHH family protein
LANRAVKLKSGQKLDQGLIDKLVSEAERGYDLSQATRVILREGRPARGEPRGESPRVASRIPEPVYRAAKKRAAREGLTVSQVVQALLAGYAAGQSSRLKIAVAKGGAPKARRTRREAIRP